MEHLEVFIVVLFVSVAGLNVLSRWLSVPYPIPLVLGGPNPTLTAQALATRTAEKIFQLYFGGDPWVRTESPMSSINDRVTKGVLAQKL